MGDYSRYSRRDGDKKYESRTPLPTRSMMGGRIYVGRLPCDLKEREMEKVFGKYGHITEISLKGTYCFIQYDSSKSSKDAVHEMNGRAAFGDRIQVEHARNPKDSAPESRPRGDFGYKRYRGRRTSNTYRGSLHSERELRCSLPKRTDYRLAVTNLTTRCDKRDLRAVMEKAGEVCYTDAHSRALGEGIVEFASRKDMERALKKLDGLEINGKLIKLEIQEVRKARKLKSKSGSWSPSGYKSSKSRSRSKSNTKYRSKSRSKSLSLSKSRSRSHSRLHSRSHSKSRSRSHSKSQSKRKRSTSKRSASPHKIIPGHSKTRDTKSDDEEFEEAERNVKRRKQEKGSDSESDNELELMSSDIQPNESQKPNNQNGDILPTQHQDEEEVEEEIEEIVEVEVEVDEDDDDNESLGRKHNTGALLINGDRLLDY